MIKVAVLGYGTVGSGVVEIFHTNKELLEKRTGKKLEVKYVFGRHQYPGTLAENKITNDFEKILHDEEIEIVAEALGGLDPAYPFVKQLLENGKSVVTSNKELVAQYGAELINTAKEHHVNFLFEASVAGGIPIIRSLHSALTADRIEKITGILNGTTNYMMTKMFYDNEDYAQVLKEAQQLGYAERNPEADVEGYDACRKIAILSSVISGKTVDFKEIYTEGITKITTADIQYAKKMDMTVKLIASAKRIDDRFQVMVSPCLLRQDHPLYDVNGVFNAVLVTGNMSGDNMFYGSGAGKLPTASAVLADIIAIVKNKGKNIMAKWSKEKQDLTAKEKSEKRFFVRMSGNQKDYEKMIEESFGRSEFVTIDDKGHEFGFVTEKIKEDVYEEKAGAFSNILHMIRIEE